jgi:hypothetical protein
VREKESDYDMHYKNGLGNSQGRQRWGLVGKCGKHRVHLREADLEHGAGREKEKGRWFVMFSVMRGLNTEKEEEEKVKKEPTPKTYCFGASSGFSWVR